MAERWSWLLKINKLGKENIGINKPGNREEILATDLVTEVTGKFGQVVLVRSLVPDGGLKGGHLGLQRGLAGGEGGNLIGMSRQRLGVGLEGGDDPTKLPVDLIESRRQEVYKASRVMDDSVQVLLARLTDATHLGLT